MAPKLKKLLASFDQTNHSGRIRMLVNIAQQNQETRALNELLDALTQLSSYHAKLVLLAAIAIDDKPRIAGLATYPLPAIRVMVLNHTELAESAAEFCTRYFNSPGYLRDHLVTSARRSDRRELIDALINHPRLSDRERAQLLAHGSPAVIAAQLPQLGDLIGSLRPLTRRYPDVVLTELTRRLVESEVGPDRVWLWAASALSELATQQPTALLNLLDEFTPSAGLPGEVRNQMFELARTDSAKFARLLAANPAALGRFFTSRYSSAKPRFRKNLRRALRTMPPAELIPIARAVATTDKTLAALLDALPPNERAEIFGYATDELELTQRVWSPAVLAALPRALRWREATRMSRLDSQTGRTNQLELAAFQSWAEVAETLAEGRRSAIATERGLAWHSELLCAGRDSTAALQGVLDRLPRLANEQDLVHVQVTAALDKLGPNALAGLNLKPLYEYTLARAQAQDASRATLTQLTRVLWLQFCTRVDTPSAAGVLEAIDTLTGAVRSVTLPTGFTTYTAELVVEALAPRIREAARNDQFDLALNLWSALGKRAWHNPVLTKVIERALKVAPQAIHRRALRYWLADPTTRDVRVASLLSSDPSYITFLEVQQVICRYRQDLVRYVLQPHPRGRFWFSDSKHVPVMRGPFDGWLPDQLEKYADRLVRLVRSNRDDTWHKASAIRVLGELPVVGARRVTPYLDSPDALEQRVAVMALAWGEDPGPALERLLGFLSTDAASTAINAIARVARFRAPDEVADAMAEVLNQPDSRLTARKGALRILGQLREEDAATTIGAIAADATQHRDLRLAAIATLTDYLDDPAAWVGPQSIAASNDARFLYLACRQPRRLAMRHRARWASLLLEAAGQDPELLPLLVHWVTFEPGIAAALTAAVIDANTSLATQCSRAIGQAAQLSTDWSSYLNATAQLAQNASTPEPAETETTLSPQSRLDLLVEELIALTPTKAGAFHPQLMTLAETLAEHPEQGTQTWRAVFAAMDWDDPADDLTRLAAWLDPMQAQECATDLREALDQLPTPPTQPMPAVTQLRANGAASAGALSLALVHWWGEQLGWPTPWRRELTQLRSHPVAAVRHWARNISLV